MPAAPSGDVLSFTEKTSNTGFFAGRVWACEIVTMASAMSAIAVLFILAVDWAERFIGCHTRRRDSNPAAFGHALQHPIASCFRPVQIGAFVEPIGIGRFDHAGKIRSFGDREI